MNLLVIVVNNFSHVGLLVGKISCVSSSTFKLQSDRSGTISFDNLFDGSFDNSSKTTAGVDNFRDALFEAVSSKFLYAGSFPLRGDFCPRDISNITFPEMLGAYLCIFTYLEVLSFVSSYLHFLTGSRSEIKSKTLLSHRLSGSISSNILEHKNESAFPPLENNSNESSQDRQLIQP